MQLPARRRSQIARWIWGPAPQRCNDASFLDLPEQISSSNSPPESAENDPPDEDRHVPVDQILQFMPEHGALQSQDADSARTERQLREHKVAKTPRVPPMTCVLDGMSDKDCPPNVFPKVSTEGKVGMCLIARDQGADLPEWLDHYRSLGIYVFNIYDHRSSPPMLQTLQNDIWHGDIQYRYFNTIPSSYTSTQIYIYNVCINDHKDLQFLGLIDADEFIVLKGGRTSLPEYLQAFEDEGHLAVHWRQFGSSNHQTRQTSVRASYTKCFRDDDENNGHVKLFINPKYAVRCISPHTVLSVPGSQTVDEQHRPVLGHRSDPADANDIELYHYVTKSLAEFQQKTLRGSANIPFHRKDMDFFNLVNAGATHDCFALADYVDDADRERGKA